jgi:hypothetical protein
MKKIEIASPLSQELSGLKGQAVLHDAEGQVLGYFSPARQDLKLEDLQLESPMSIEELETIRQRYAGKRPEEFGKPLEEILHRLGF